MAENKSNPRHYFLPGGRPTMPIALAAVSHLPAAQAALVFTALKYLLRIGKKKGETVADDASKAIMVLQILIAHIAENAPPSKKR